MDTDDLSQEAYEGILTEADQLSDDLSLHFGRLSYDCKNETEFLEQSLKLIKDIKKFDEEELNDFFNDNAPDPDELKATLERIVQNIKEIKKIPLNKRHFEE